MGSYETHNLSDDASRDEPTALGHSQAPKGLRGLPIAPLTTTNALDAFAEAVQLAISTTCDNHMTQRVPSKASKHPWWNEECATAARTVRSATSTLARREARKELSRITRAAKPKHYDKVIEIGDIWSLAAWRKGRSLSGTPALKSLTGGIVTGQGDIANELNCKFFVEEDALGNIPAAQHDDPPPPRHPTTSPRRTQGG
ncbi:hypothetical protein EDB87DRAFT_1579896 [Lactarius vividus]|nr:hypothetical protein EDB87DRAFT_1579896 [Lactarius vividus]